MGIYDEKAVRGLNALRGRFAVRKFYYHSCRFSAPRYFDTEIDAINFYNTLGEVEEYDRGIYEYTSYAGWITYC